MAKNRSVKVIIVSTSREEPGKNPNILCDSKPCVKLGEMLGGSAKNLNYKQVREKLCDGCGTPLCWC